MNEALPAQQLPVFETKTLQLPLMGTYLKTKALHLSIGSGESIYMSLTMQIADELERNGKFMGLPAREGGMHVIHAFLNHSLAHTHLSSMERILTPESGEPVTWNNQEGMNRPSEILEAVRDFALGNFPPSQPNRLLILYDLPELFPSNITIYGEIKTLCMQLRDLANVTGSAVLAHVPTSKNSRRSEDPRDRGIGSSAWSDAADTVFMVDFPPDSDTSTPVRRLYITRPGRPTVYHDLIWRDDNSGFDSATNDSNRLSLTEQLSQELMSSVPGARFLRKQLFRHITRDGQIQASDSTLKRWLSDALETGMIKKGSGRGSYVYDPSIQ